MPEIKNNHEMVHVCGSAECISSYLKERYELSDDFAAVSITQLLVLLNNEENGEFDFEGLSHDQYPQQLTTGLLGALPVYIKTYDTVIKTVKGFPKSLIYVLIQQLMVGDLSLRALVRESIKDFLVTLAKSIQECAIELKDSQLCICYRAWQLTKGRRPFSFEELTLDVERVGYGRGQERRFICALSRDDNIQQTPQAVFRCPSYREGNYCCLTEQDFITILEALCELKILEKTGDEDRYAFQR